MFTSTRFKTRTKASKAILEGLAPKGGLYVKEDFNASFFNRDLLTLDYKTLTKKIFNEFLDDYSDETIHQIVEECYGDSFNEEIVTINHFDDMSILELYNGETFAFKDMALSILPSLFSEAKNKVYKDKKSVILVATSGDTGSAALSGFSKLDNTYTIVLYPKNGVSRFQELQMSQYVNDHCFVYAIDGDFDDCQRIVKDVFQNIDLKKTVLSSANSINIGRIIPQIVYYFYTYLKLVNEKRINYGDKINYTVPTGNFGNVYAGYIAKRMGLPIKNLVIASNSNNVLTDLFNRNQYTIDRQLLKTISPSMDIIVSSNFERYLFDLTKSYDTVKDYMNRLKNDKEIHISELKDNQTFLAYFSNEVETKRCIHSFYQKHQYLIDPHTAVAYDCYLKYLKDYNDNTYHVVLSTASPYKFADSIIDALSLKMPNSLEGKINLLHDISKNRFDERVLKVIHSSIKSKTLSVEESYNYIKKVIGDLDDKN